MDLKNIFLAISAVINLFLGIITYFRNRKNNINFFWFLACMTVVFWTISMIIYRSVDYEHSLFWCKILYISATLIPSFLLFFTFLFPERKTSLSLFQKILIFFPNFFVILLILSNGLVIREVILHVGEEKEIKWGPFYFLYVIYITVFFLFVIFNLFLKYKKAQEILKLQLKYMLTGIMISVFFGTLFNLFLPSFGNFKFNWLGQITTLFYVVFVTLAITKYHLFGIKIILTELLIGAMGIILFILPFLMPTFILKVFTFFIFLLFLIFSYPVLKYTYQEEQLREQAEKLAKEWQMLAQSKDQFIISIQHHFRTLFCF